LRCVVFAPLRDAADCKEHQLLGNRFPSTKIFERV
jgi:hypothetical protein